MRIFISHSSQNKELLSRFVDTILIKGIGIDENAIFCTSIDGMNVKSGDDFKAAIRKQLMEATIILLMVSDEYKESEICLNEMGAAWMRDVPVIPFIIGQMSYDKVGVIHGTTQMIRLENSADLMKFCDDHKDQLISSNFNKKLYEQCVTGFVGDLATLQLPMGEVSPSTKKKLDVYFEKFTNPDIDTFKLLLNAQPNLSDCRSIFDEDIYEHMYRFYSLMFSSPSFRKNNIGDVAGRNVVEYKSHKLKNSFDSISSIPGGMNDLEVRKHIRNGTQFISVSFRRSEDQYGIVVFGWVFLNGRWVLFPKPWKVVASVNKILEVIPQTEADLKSFKKLLKPAINKNIKGIELDFFASSLIKEFMETP